MGTQPRIAFPVCVQRVLDNDVVGQKPENLTDAQRAGTKPPDPRGRVIGKIAMEDSMFPGSGIAGCRENRLLDPKMPSHIANQDVDHHVYLIHGSPTEYRGSQTVDIIEQTLVF